MSIYSLCSLFNFWSEVNFKICSRRRGRKEGEGRGREGELEGRGRGGQCDYLTEFNLLSKFCIRILKKNYSVIIIKLA